LNVGFVVIIPLPPTGAEDGATMRRYESKIGVPVAVPVVEIAVVVSVVAVSRVASMFAQP
jgi:hypothetical protein